MYSLLYKTLNVILRVSTSIMPESGWCDLECNFASICLTVHRHFRSGTCIVYEIQYSYLAYVHKDSRNACD